MTPREGGNPASLHRPRLRIPEAVEPVTTGKRLRQGPNTSVDSLNSSCQDSNVPRTAGLDTSVTGMREKAVPLAVGADLPGDSIIMLIHRAPHIKKLIGVPVGGPERTVESQLPGKDISISFLGFCPNPGVTDEQPQENRHDYWSCGFLLSLLTLESYYLLA